MKRIELDAHERAIAARTQARCDEILRAAKAQQHLVMARAIAECEKLAAREAEFLVRRVLAREPGEPGASVTPERDPATRQLVAIVLERPNAPTASD